MLSDEYSNESLGVITAHYVEHNKNVVFSLGTITGSQPS